jgi:hypothetical protein
MAKEADGLIGASDGVQKFDQTSQATRTQKWEIDSGVAQPRPERQRHLPVEPPSPKRSNKIDHHRLRRCLGPRGKRRRTGSRRVSTRHRRCRFRVHVGRLPFGYPKSQYACAVYRDRILVFYRVTIKMFGNNDTNMHSMLSIVLSVSVSHFPPFFCLLVLAAWPPILMSVTKMIVMFNLKFYMIKFY